MSHLLELRRSDDHAAAVQQQHRGPFGSMPVGRRDEDPHSRVADRSRGDIDATARAMT